MKTISLMVILALALCFGYSVYLLFTGAEAEDGFMAAVLALFALTNLLKQDKKTEEAPKHRRIERHSPWLR